MPDSRRSLQAKVRASLSGEYLTARHPPGWFAISLRVAVAAWAVGQFIRRAPKFGEECARRS